MHAWTTQIITWWRIKETVEGGTVHRRCASSVSVNVIVASNSAESTSAYKEWGGTTGPGCDVLSTCYECDPQPGDLPPHHFFFVSFFNIFWADYRDQSFQASSKMLLLRSLLFSAQSLFSPVSRNGVWLTRQCLKSFRILPEFFWFNFSACHLTPCNSCRFRARQSAPRGGWSGWIKQAER